ncbi:iron-containing alcohol dehydrogenase [Shimia sp.]|uniref:iron-containing alcohol dehydrogenase n=1 Tax=Shimia sp. TaxID=1954381 RepID=UPI003298EE4F
MTLIDYLNRVHFADGILEEALWAELEQMKNSKFLVLATRETFAGDLGERIKNGLPKQFQSVTFEVSGGVPNEAEAQYATKLFRAEECDAILAFGRGYVINQAKAVRLLVTYGGPLFRFSEAEGGGVRISRNMPELIAIPCMQGFVAGFNGLLSVVLDDGRMIDIVSRNNVPTVTIGDPTIALSEAAAVQASAGVEAISLCIEALLSPKYNPPANGIAMDGLIRGLRAVTSVSENADLDPRRELMAAAMNSALVQQKGLGLAHAITSSLCSVVLGTLDKGAVKRLLLPKILNYYVSKNVLAGSPLLEALRLSNPRDAVKTVSRVLRDLPLPASLSEMGITEDHLAQCTERASMHRALSNTPHHPTTGDIREILTSIH